MREHEQGEHHCGRFHAAYFRFLDFVSQFGFLQSSQSLPTNIFDASFVALELPPEPVRRDVGELTAARVIDCRGVTRTMARTVEHGLVVDRLEIGQRSRHHEVALVPVDQQHRSVQLAAPDDVPLRPS